MDGVYGLSFTRPKDNLRLNLPDGCNNGPILPSYDGNNELRTVKNLRKKFMYRHSTFAIPASYVSEVESNCKATKHSENHKNKIKMFNIKDKDYIAYTKPSMTGSLCKFVISEIHKNKTGESYFLEETDTSQLCNGIDVSVCDNEASALLIGEDQFQIVKLPSLKPIVASKTRRKIADASLHKTLKNYFTLLDSKGTIHVFNCEREYPCWSQDLSPQSISNNSFVSCQFGYHPQSVYVANDKRVISFDTRMGRGIGNSLMFSLSNIGSSFEQKISSTIFNDSPYMYVNCTNTIYLIDGRYVKEPILSWNHLLPSGTSYCDLISIRSEDILLLGNSNDSQICFITTKSNTPGSGKLYVPETSLPFHSYPIEDTLRNANANDMWYHSTVKERFTSRWMGLGVRSVADDKFCVWMQNVHGDLMHQTYEPIQLESTGLENYDCSPSWRKVMKRYQNSIMDAVTANESLKRCKITHPIAFHDRNAMNRKNNSIYISKHSNKIFWKTQDIIERWENGLVGKGVEDVLVSSFKLSQTKSRYEYVDEFSDYKRETCKSLDPKSYKNTLALVWNRDPADDSSSDECQNLFDTTATNQEEMSLLHDTYGSTGGRPVVKRKDSNVGDESLAALIDYLDFSMVTRSDATTEKPSGFSLAKNERETSDVK